MSQDNQVVIYTAANEAQAYRLHNELADRGIRSMVANGDLARGRGVDYIGWQTDPRVIVLESDADAARAVALEFDQRLQGSRSEDDAATDATEPSDARQSLPPHDASETCSAPRVVNEWPRCPRCGAPRVARCPICATTGIDFPPAEPPPTDFSADDVLNPGPSDAAGCHCGPHGCGHADAHGADEAAPALDDAEDAAIENMLICTICDEPFAPKFGSRCAQCGHAFDDGWAPEESADGQVARLNGIVLAAVLALGGVTLAAVFYFFLVLRG